MRNCVNGSNGQNVIAEVEKTLEHYYAFVKKLVDAFDVSKLDFALTGAIAVSFYGIPRTTSDVDIMISVAREPELKKKLAAALEQADIQMDERKIEAALTSGFKIATFKSKTAPYTVDIILSNNKLDKKQGQIADFQTFFQSPEGLVAAKLRMIKATLSPERAVKDKEDIKAIVAFTKVNVAAIKKQAKKDKTMDIFEALIASG